jgi:predicted translin family RNA/ssDNA-binding protein
MENIYQGIMRFDYPSALVPIRKKQDMARNLIEKTRGELVIASCERRIEHRIDEFKELLDKVTDSKKRRKEKIQDEGDLDIDRVW